jgi:hypothetical protein
VEQVSAAKVWEYLKKSSWTKNNGTNGTLEHFNKKKKKKNIYIYKSIT